MISLLILLISLVMVSLAEGQITCFTYGTVVSCDGPNLSNRTITDLGSDLRRPSGQGVITDERGNVMPYAIIPSPTPRSSGIEPLRPLNRLDTLESPSRSRSLLDEPAGKSLLYGDGW